VEIDELVNAVESLEDEQHVTRVHNAAVARMKQLHERRLREIRDSLPVGQRVRTNDLTKPRFLRGLTGTVVEPPGTSKVKVKWDEPERARQYAAPDGTAPIGFGALEVVTDAGSSSLF